MRSPIENPSPQHLIASEVKKRVQGFWDTAFKFSVIRDPIERLVSEFMWRLPPKPAPFELELRNDEESFNKLLLYAEKVVEEGEYKLHTQDHFRPQVEFLDEPLDKVFKNIVKLQVYFDQILPKLNATDEPNDILSERNIDLIKKIYVKDYEFINNLTE